MLGVAVGGKLVTLVREIDTGNGIGVGKLYM